MKHLLKVALVLSIVLISNNISGQGWTVTPSDYSYNGQVTVIVFHGANAVTTGTLGAFVGGTCRGFVTGTYFPPTGKTVFTVLCYSNLASGETLTFRYFDPSDGSYYDIQETLGFVSDMIVGDAMSPLQYHTVPLIYTVTGGGSYCQGGSGLPVGLSDSESGVTYTLYKNGIAQTPTIAGTGSAISFGNQLGGTYTVSGNNSGGTINMTGNAVIIENPLPLVPLNSSGSGATCTQITANWSSSANATSYALDVSPVNDFSSFIPGFQDLNVSNVTTYNIPGLTAGTSYYYRVRAVNSCGTSANSGTITYSTSPAAPSQPGTITGTSVQCPALTGQVYSISSVTNATTYTWTVPAGWSVTAGAGTTSITVTTGASGQNGNITVTAGNSCGTSTASTLAVTVNPGTPSQPGTITGTAVQCPALTSQVYSISSVTNATTYTWIVPAGWSVTAGAGTTSITVTTGAAGQNGNITVTAGNSCGTSTASSLAVTINPGTPSQPGTITGTAAQCPALIGQVYSISSVTNATTYTWTVPAGWSVTAGAGTTSITVTTGAAGQNGNITVTAGNSCGTSTASTLAVTVNPGTPSQPGTITGTVAQCPALTGQVYSISPVTNATTYTWTVPTGWTITAGVGTTSISLTTGASEQNGNVTVTAGNSCGTSTASTLAVTVNPGTPSQPGTITGTVAQCPALTGQIYSISSVTNATTYTWTVPAGWSITAGAGTTSITVTTGAAGQNDNITVTAGNSCGTSTASTLAVTVNPGAPSQPGTMTGTAVQCPALTGQVYSISSVTNATTYTWTVPAGWSVTAGAGTTSITVTTGAAGQNGNINVTAGNSCGTSTASTLAVTIQALPSQPTVSLTQPTCLTTTGTITITAPTGSGMTYSIDGVTYINTTGIFTTVSPGSYTVTAKSSAGCLSPGTFVTINTQPVTPTAPVVGTITAPTCTVSTGSVILSGLPPSGTWTLVRSPGGTITTGTGTSTTVSPIPAGNTYTYTVTNSDGCTSSPSSNVVIPVQPVTPSAPVVGTITAPTCSVSTGSVLLSGLPSSGTWTLTRYPGTITSTGSGTSITISGLPSGTYNYTVTNDAGCTSSLSSNVVIPAQPVTPTAPTLGTITQPTCALSTGSVVLNSLPSSGTWTVTTSPGGTTTTGTGISTTIAGLTAGTYTFTVTNSDGCTSSSSSSVVINTQPATPTAPVIGTITQPTCALATGSVALSGLPASGTWTLTRSPGNITTTGTGTGTTISGISAGTYNYTVTNAAGCTSPASSDVVINAQPPSPSSPLQTVDCSLGFGNAIVTVTSPTGTGLNYKLDAGTYQASTTFTGVANGNHTITVINASGCTTTGSSFNVNCGCVNPPTLTLSSLSGSVCGTIPVTVSGNTFGGSAITVTITENGAGSVSPSSASSSPFSFTYTPTAGDAGNTVTITVITDNPLGTPCAAATATYTLTVNSTPSAPLVGTITQPTCAVATGSVVLNGLPSSGTWTLTRSPGNITTSGTGTSTTISALPAGTYTYTVTTAAGCTSASSANIVINTQPATPSAPAIGTITAPTCTVATGSVIINGLPASGTWTLTRNPGSITTSGTGTTTTITGIYPGTYNFTVTNSSGCTSSNSSDVIIPVAPIVPTAPQVGPITPPTCILSTGSVVLSGLPSSGSWTLTMYPGTITTSGSGASTTISGLPAGTYNYTVTNDATCTSLLSANIIIPVQPVTPTAPVVGTITQPTCLVATGSVILTGLPASGTWTLTRSPGGATTMGSGTSTTISGLDAGTYTFIVTNADGCTSSSSANVIINTQPATPTAPVVGAITQPTCALAIGSVALSGLPSSGTWTLTISPGGGTTTGSGTSKTITGLATGTYTYTVTNSSECTSASSANIVINTQPVTPTAPAVGTITQPTCAVSTGSVMLNSLPATGTWTLTRNPGSVTTIGTGTSITQSGLSSGTYTYTVTNSDGCTSSSSSNVIINIQPVTPSAPVIGTITQPTCILATGSVALSGLPSSGTWTLTRNPGGVTTSGTGTSTTVTNLVTGSYSFTVTNSDGCTSSSSGSVVINTQPVTPTAPVVGTIIQPTCALATGSVALSGLPLLGSWTLTRNPGGVTTTGTGTGITATNVPSGTFTYTVTNSDGCTSVASSNVVINAQPITPTAPVVGTITAPTCFVSTGSAILNGLPPTGTWTLTRSPGGITSSGTGTSTTISGLNQGTYTYTVTNSDGCTSPSSTNIVIPAQPTTPIAPVVGTITAPTCSVSTGSVVLSGLPSSGTWTLIRYPGTITSTGSGASTTISALSTGTYNYTVTNVSGCTSPLSSNVDIPAQPVTPTAPVTGAITQPTCAVATGSVMLSGLPSTGTWTLTTSPGGATTTGTGTSTTITGLTSGTYTFTVTNSDGCTSSSSSNVVINTQPATPTAPVAGTITQPTCALATGSVALSGLPSSGTWTLTRTPGNVTTTGTGTSTTISGISAGTYNYTVTNAAGCTSPASSDVVINAQPSSPSSPIQTVDCSLGFGNAMVTVTSPTGAGLDYKLDAGTYQTSTTFTGVANGNHTITARNASGCTTTGSSFNVNCGCVNPPSVTLSSVSGSICGLTAMNINGNTFGGSATIVAITENGAGSVSPALTGTSPFSFTYIPAAGDIGKTVTITVTTNNPLGAPCAAMTATYNLAVNAIPTAPTVGTITQPTCAVATGSAVLGGLPSTGTWTLTQSPGGTTSSGTGTSTTISGLATGTYTYTVTSAAGCTSVSSANIVINTQPATPSAPVVGTITQPACTVSTGSVVLSGLPSTGTWTLTRSPGGNTITGTGTSTTISALPSGTYNFTVTNSSGCISASSVDVVINVQPATPSAPSLGTITQPTCAVATGSVILLGLPSSGTWTLICSPGGATTTGTGTSTTFSALATGTYTFTVTNSAGCTSASSSSVVINAQPVTPVAPVVGIINQPTCIVSTGSVGLSGLPATGTWTLIRNPGSVTTTGTGTTTTVSVLATGTYNFAVINSVGCTSSFSADVIINAQPSTPTAPVIDQIIQPTCTVSTGSVQFSSLPASGTWTLIRYPGAFTTTGTGTTSTISGLAAGTFNYTVTNSAGCVSVISANVVITPQPVTPSAPVVGVIAQTTCILPTGSVALSGLPSSGTWTLTSSPAGVIKAGTGTSTTVPGLDPGTYTFMVTNAVGCTSAVSENVVINPQPETTPSLIITDPFPVCYPAIADLTAALVTAGSTSDLTYSYWTDADATVPIVNPSEAAEGTYYIKGTSALGCYVIRPVYVTSYLPPTADAGPDQVLEYVFETTLDANNPGVNETGTWSVSSGSGSFVDANDPKTMVTGLAPEENILLWTVSNGVCPIATDFITVKVNNLVIPTLITPNMDGKNDYFVLRGIETLGKTELIIFDRRGLRVYKNENYNNDWNGVDYNNNPLPDDTYFYVIRSENGKSLSGYIVIRR